VDGDDVIRVDLRSDSMPEVITANSGIGAQCVAVDAADPDRLVTGTFDNGAFLSSDGGHNWKQISDGIPSPQVRSGSHRAGGKGAIFAGVSGCFANMARTSGFRNREWCIQGGKDFCSSMVHRKFGSLSFDSKQEFVQYINTVLPDKRFCCSADFFSNVGIEKQRTRWDVPQGVFRHVGPR